MMGPARRPNLPISSSPHLPISPSPIPHPPSPRPQAVGASTDPKLFADLVLKNMDRLCQRFTCLPAAAALPAGHGPLIKTQMNNGTEWVTAIKTGSNATVQQRPCHVCKRHYVKAVYTGHACPKCNVPLCKLDWSDHDTDRTRSCYHEHMLCTDEGWVCSGEMASKTWKLKKGAAPTERKDIAPSR